jgi:hypothetical protein
MLSAQECAEAKDTLAALQYEEPTTEQREILEQTQASGTITKDQVQELAACGGSYRFKVANGRLLCADGNPVPFVGGASSHRPLSDRTAIVFHSTGSPDNSFAAMARLLSQGRPGTEAFPGLAGPLAHLVISRSGAVVQSGSFDIAAYHVGRATPWNGVTVKNSNSIGIELINQGASSKQPFTPAQIAAAEGIARALVDTYGIRVIVGHSDLAPGRKTDPGPLFPIAAVRQAAGLPAG